MVVVELIHHRLEGEGLLDRTERRLILIHDRVVVLVEEGHDIGLVVDVLLGVLLHLLRFCDPELQERRAGIEHHVARAARVRAGRVVHVRPSEIVELGLEGWRLRVRSLLDVGEGRTRG